MNAWTFWGLVLIGIATGWTLGTIAALLVQHYREQRATAEWERHISTLLTETEVDARLNAMFPPWEPTDTPLYDATKRAQDVRFMAEAIDELRGMGVDLAEGEAP